MTLPSVGTHTHGCSQGRGPTRLRMKGEYLNDTRGESTGLLLTRYDQLELSHIAYRLLVIDETPREV